jgi:hypothetical protein
MAGDVPIVNRPSLAAPKDYLIPGTQEIILRSVGAAFDGSGSASSFLPALQLLAPDGTVMFTAVDPNNSVAAGASADVSWFPGVTPTPSTGVKIINCRTTTAPWASGGPPGNSSSWTTQYNYDTSVFSLQNDYQDIVHILAPGKYLVAVTDHWDTTTYGATAWVEVAGGIASYNVWKMSGAVQSTAAFTGSYSGFQDIWDAMIAVVPASASFPVSVYMDGFQSSGTDLLQNAKLIALQLDATASP